MHLSKVMLLSLGVALSVAACGGDDPQESTRENGQSEASGTGDQASADGGSGSSQSDGGSGDAGSTEPTRDPNEDVGPCDPVRNQGCTEAGEVCRPYFTRDKAVCEAAAEGSTGFGEACPFPQNTCGPKMVCIGTGSPMPVNNPVCTRVCYAKTGAGCEDLKGYYCDTKNLVSENAKLALCRPSEDAGGGSGSGGGTGGGHEGSDHEGGTGG